MEESVYELEGYDFAEYESFYGYEETEGELEEEGMRASEVLRYCVAPTVSSAYRNLGKLFAACLLYRVARDVLRLPQRARQALSAGGGIYVMWLYSDWLVVQSLALALLGFLLLRLSSLRTSRYRGYCVALPLVGLLVACELTSGGGEDWTRIRGTQMTLAMRAVSLAFDLDWGTVVDEPTLLDYASYTFCVATSALGPWVPYGEYRSGGGGGGGGGKWVTAAASAFLLSLASFSLSTCWIEWLLPPSSHPLWSLYREALLFRTSHYFVCYAAQTSLAVAGVGSGAPVTRPRAVELPHSLVSVVVGWNVPTHRWLKTYVFRTTRACGGFVAVMSTYLVSALLHGLNCRLAAVLLSLGLYTYAEYSLRERLSSRFSACLSARPCPSPCSDHLRTSDNLLVNTANLLFSALAVFHLAYLGVLVDPTRTTSCSESFTEWHDLNYASHWLALTTYLLYLVV